MNNDYKSKSRIIRRKKRNKENSKENEKVKIFNSSLNISKYQPIKIYDKIPKKILIDKEKLKGIENNISTCIFQETENNENFNKIISLKNKVRPLSSNNLKGKFFLNKSKIFENKNTFNLPIDSCYKTAKFKTIKKGLFAEENFEIKKRIHSSYKRSSNNIINSFNDSKNFGLIQSNKRRKRNLTENNLDYFDKRTEGRNISFFKNKYLQKNTDSTQIRKLLLNKNALNIKFSRPKNFNTYNVVDNNISLENTFKRQTLSNFNNKYNFKFKTKNIKEKEKIKKLFNLLKKHKDSENAKNSDFLNFHLYEQKKLELREMYKNLFEEYLNPNDYYTTENNNNNLLVNSDYDLIHKKRKKMITVKSFQINN